MTHLDLFSGIGGFALAAQTVWGEDYHCVGFCEIDSFCQNVLRKNFEGVNIYGDIRGLTAERLAADTIGERDGGVVGQRDGEEEALPEGAPGPQEPRTHEVGDGHPRPIVDLLTGGFPCQPFSTAGKRKGTEDDRFLWPEMFRVIRETKPRWVLGENVAGIIEMALGQVCAGLESLDYEVQCFVIPACAVNAPHRRDRVWIVAHSTGDRRFGGGEMAEVEEGLPPRPESVRQLEGRLEGCDCPSSDTNSRRQERCEQQATGGQQCRGSTEPSSDTPGEHGEWAESIGGGCRQSEMPAGDRDCPSSDTESARLSRREPEGNLCTGRCDPEYAFPDWSRDWREVAFESCVRGVDDGVPKRVARLPDGSTITESRLRQNSLKAYGNAIVPEVAMELMRAIKAVDEQPIELKEWNA